MAARLTALLLEALQPPQARLLRSPQNGIDDNADATAITIDSSENVGIGGSLFLQLDALWLRTQAMFV